MSRKPKPQRREGLTRRDFVQGRFWRALKLRKAARDTPEEPKRKRLQRVSLVMRYPRTRREVAAADTVPSSTTVADSISDSAARRRTIPVFRPPGAIEETRFLATCTRCNECAKACPHDAIVAAPERMREAASTPMIEADHQACMMCEDFPCIEACEPKALSSLVPPMMGTAMVTQHLCLAHHGTTCTVCSERCPVPGAIVVTEGKPTVKEDVCTGCGVCRFVCPAPENAILLMPAFLRPSPPENSTNES